MLYFIDFHCGYPFHVYHKQGNFYLIVLAKFSPHDILVLINKYTLSDSLVLINKYTLYDTLVLINKYTLCDTLVLINISMIKFAFLITTRCVL